MRTVATHVEYGAHVQTADRRVCVPRAACAVFFENAREPVRVFREMLERHRAVLDEGDRFAVAFHGHHDVEARFTDFPDIALQGWIDNLDNATRKTEVTHELGEPAQTLELLRAVVPGKLHQQNRLGGSA